MLHLLAQTATALESATRALPSDAPAHGGAFYSLLSVLLGVVEGVTEFLPISSTAHLRLTEDLLHLDLKSDYWKMYSVVIQLGAILSVPVLFKDRILKLLRTFPKGESGDKTFATHPLSLVMIGFFVTVGPCYLADKFIGKNLESLWVMGGALLVGGIVMWAVDAAFRKPKTLRMEDMTIADAVWIGLVQVLSALFPGTSRSMSTIAAGQVFSLSRATALEYSFFLSIPTMLAATGYKFLQAIVHRPKTPAEIQSYGAPPGQWAVLAIGFVVSFVVAWAVNRWFIRWVQRHGFLPFAIYRIIIGSVVLLMAAKLIGA
jgi:undecaprenyl-diphosphatase